MITTTTIKTHNQVGVRMNLTRGLINLILEIYENRIEVYAGFINELYYMETAYVAPAKTVEAVEFYAHLSSDVILREVAREME